MLPIALSAFDIATLVAVIGMLACRLAVLPRDANVTFARRLHAATRIALALLTLASLGILLSRTLELNGVTWNTLARDAWLALDVTHFGHVWLWRLPALALLWLALAWNARHPHGHAAGWAMLAAAAAIALTRSETGHPSDHGDFTLAVWMDWLHMLAAAIWVGSLFGMTLVVFPQLLRKRERLPVTAAAAFQRLSTLSGAALAVLLACGIFNAWQQLGGLSSLWSTRYGIVLDVKLALVLAMIAIGAHNRYVKLPRLSAQAGLQLPPRMTTRWLPTRWRAAPARAGFDGVKSCARAVLAESLLGLAVIATTATLIHAMPPAGQPRMQAAMTHADAERMP